MREEEREGGHSGQSGGEGAEEEEEEEGGGEGGGGGDDDDDGCGGAGGADVVEVEVVLEAGWRVCGLRIVQLATVAAKYSGGVARFSGGACCSGASSGSDNVSTDDGDVTSTKIARDHPSIL
jgi:hypothetical protein